MSKSIQTSLLWTSDTVYVFGLTAFPLIYLLPMMYDFYSVYTTCIFFLSYFSKTSSSKNERNMLSSILLCFWQRPANNRSELVYLLFLLISTPLAYTINDCCFHLCLYSNRSEWSTNSEFPVVAAVFLTLCMIYMLY